MAIGLVLFDLDGTLLDTLGDIADAMNDVLGVLGLPGHPEESYKTFVGEGVRFLVERALPRDRRDPGTVARGLALLEERYRHRPEGRTSPYPGIPALLDALSARRLPLAVLSNKPEPATLAAVRDHLPRWDFRSVAGAREGVPLKPDPAPALAIAADAGVDPAAVLYLGDTGVDMRTARAAGMRAAGALWGFRGREELVATGAEFLVTAPGEVLTLVENLGARAGGGA
jgi:phosphoglycolate phosphatase